MNCAFHPDAPAVAQCASCGRELCESCRVELTGGSYCHACLEDRMANGPVPKLVGRKNRFFSFVFSLVPGVGQMYLELMQRGLSIMVLFFGAVALAVAFNGPEIFIVVGPVLYFYSFFDALQVRRRIHSGEPVTDVPLFTWQQAETWLNLQPRQTQRLLAYGLIIYGGLRLVHNFFGYWLVRLGIYMPSFNYLVFPALLVAAGLWLLNSEKQRRGQDA